MRLGGCGWLCFCFAVAAAAALGCSSTSGVPFGALDSGAPPEDSGAGGGGPPDAGMCDGSLPTMGSGAAAACTACRVNSCVSATAACAADCACGPIGTCLETTMNYNFTECPNAISASTGGNAALTMLIQCLDTHCLAPCFQSGGADGGGEQ